MCRGISCLFVSWLLRYHTVKELVSTVGHFSLLRRQMSFISLFLLGIQSGNVKVLLALVHFLVALEVCSVSHFGNHSMVLSKSFLSREGTSSASEFLRVAHAPLSYLVFGGHASVQIAVPALAVLIIEALIESGRSYANLHAIIICACIHSSAHHMRKDSCHVSNPIYFLFICGRDTFFFNSDLSDSSWLLRWAILWWRFLSQIGAI